MDESWEFMTPLPPSLSTASNNIPLNPVNTQTTGTSASSKPLPKPVAVPRPLPPMIRTTQLQPSASAPLTRSATDPQAIEMYQQMMQARVRNANNSSPRTSPVKSPVRASRPPPPANMQPLANGSSANMPRPIQNNIQNQPLPALSLQQQQQLQMTRANNASPQQMRTQSPQQTRTQSPQQSRPAAKQTEEKKKKRKSVFSIILKAFQGTPEKSKLKAAVSSTDLRLPPGPANTDENVPLAAQRQSFYQQPAQKSQSLPDLPKMNESLESNKSMDPKSRIEAIQEARSRTLQMANEQARKEQALLDAAKAAAAAASSSTASLTQSPPSVLSNQIQPNHQRQLSQTLTVNHVMSPTQRFKQVVHSRSSSFNNQVQPSPPVPTSGRTHASHRMTYQAPVDADDFESTPAQSYAEKLADRKQKRMTATAALALKLKRGSTATFESLEIKDPHSTISVPSQTVPPVPVPVPSVPVTRQSQAPISVPDMQPSQLVTRPVPPPIATEKAPQLPLPVKVIPKMPTKIQTVQVQPVQPQKVTMVASPTTNTAPILASTVMASTKPVTTTTGERMSVMLARADTDVGHLYDLAAKKSNNSSPSDALPVSSLIPTKTYRSDIGNNVLAEYDALMGEFNLINFAGN